jgi:autotransporter-associated beta strand protein
MGALVSETELVTAPISGAGNLQIGGTNVNSGTDIGVVALQANNNYSGNTTVATGTLLANGSAPNTSVNVISGGTLGGTGGIGGTVTVQNGGSIAPGVTAQGALTNTIGTLTAGGAASLSGAVVMKINRAASPTSDKLAAPGVSINSGATLTVVNIGSTNLVAGDTFALFSTPVAGSFTSLSLPALPGSSVAWTNKLAVNGTIAVVVTVNPSPTNIIFSVSGNQLTLSWPADHLGWYLQVQTNSLTTGISTNWITIPGSDEVVSTNLTFDRTNGAVFYRMIYP